MNRRDFVKTALLAGVALVLPKAPEVVQAAPRAALRLQGGRVVNAAGTSQMNFGSDVTAKELRQQDGVWYVRLAQAERSFWLKSYNGRAWGTLNWQPKPGSSARR